MFEILKKDKFSCIGVNPKADWRKMDSLIVPLEFHQYLKKKIYTKDDIILIQKELNRQNLPYQNLFEEFNWVSVIKQNTLSVQCQSLLTLITGVRKEFENSHPHIEIYENYIAPSIILNISKNPSNYECSIENVKEEYSKKGVIVPLHFDRISIFEKEIKDNKTGIVFYNIEINEKLEGFNLEPRGHKKLAILIDEMYDKIKNGEKDISLEDSELVDILKDSEKFNGIYNELNCLVHLGICNYKVGNKIKAEYYFERMINTQTDISKKTIASDFIRGIGFMYEENNENVKALYWYKKAIEFSPTVGLKKKIKELES